MLSFQDKVAIPVVHMELRPKGHGFPGRSKVIGVPQSLHKEVII